ncbi:hypothetical protein EVAR_79912_1 [Eumeta japonica]|uniref:Uncharacterized protein n=1 Tax=Eumeta variegata TaxID=151549 RepID=A0A4C1TZ18_EUMVA|nr:hypothetical protein EVAR_79912_1 [Eumeta japonica]
MDHTTTHMLQVENRSGQTQRKNQYIATVAGTAGRSVGRSASAIGCLLLEVGLTSGLPLGTTSKNHLQPAVSCSSRRVFGASIAISAIIAGTLLAWTSPTMPEFVPANTTAANGTDDTSGAANETRVLDIELTTEQCELTALLCNSDVLEMYSVKRDSDCAVRRAVGVDSWLGADRAICIHHRVTSKMKTSARTSKIGWPKEFRPAHSKYCRSTVYWRRSKTGRVTPVFCPRDAGGGGATVLLTL